MENPNGHPIPLLDVAGIAEALGVPLKSVYYYVSRNEIPFLKVGKHLRFQLDQVLSHFQKKTEESKLACAE
ncbi:MAG: helix-turn-helix domain-containing protein [Deltaproteobacteria bacterium]|nr:helix-turn-helix domain-containing protein [Deltaproteobacteria bacterium]MBI3293092.1 helix-turn-helix domain-containing protein [Deltaproteobacteria bacterium]